MTFCLFQKVSLQSLTAEMPLVKMRNAKGDGIGIEYIYVADRVCRMYFNAKLSGCVIIAVESVESELIQKMLSEGFCHTNIFSSLPKWFEG